MSNEEHKVEIDMLRAIGHTVEGIIASVQTKECLEYCSKFEKQAISTKEAGDKTYPAWRLLRNLTFIHFVPSDRHKPFAPAIVWEKRRSPIPDDIPNESLDALSEWLSDVNDAELSARIADVLWLRRRNPHFLKTSVQSYIKSALNLEDSNHWTLCAERLERALHLSALLKKQNPGILRSVVKPIEKIISKYNGTDPLFLSIKLMELLCEFGCGDAKQYYDFSCKIAEQAHSQKLWQRAEKAWRVAQKWALLLKDNNKQDVAIVGQAETLAGCAMNHDQDLVSADLMQKAIEVYRKVGRQVAGFEKRMKELYKLLRKYQKNSLGQMKRIKGPEIDITEIIKKAQEAVSGKSLEETVLTLAIQIAQPPNYEDIKKQSKQNAKKFVFSSMFGRDYLDNDGLKIAEAPPMLGFKDGEDEKAIWAAMLLAVQMHHDLCVQGVLEPARQTILSKHKIKTEDLYPFLQNNPFIPPGHEYIYVKGLYAGFMGDFLEATHILVPQIENSLRYILEGLGVEATTLNPQGFQEKTGLGLLLKHENIVNTFGLDTVLDLQALLIEPKYSNLRNKVAHGLISTDECFDSPVIYFWWLVLRLCFIPYYRSLSDNAKNKNDGSSHTGDKTAS